jgi:hypothetical protein
VLLPIKPAPPISRILCVDFDIYKYNLTVPSKARLIRAQAENLELSTRIMHPGRLRNLAFARVGLYYFTELMWRIVILE